MTANIKDISSLTALAFEIEGLLMLAERRDEMTPAEVFDLLDDKCAQLLDGVASLRPGHGAEQPGRHTAPAGQTLCQTPETGDASVASAAVFEERADAGMDADASANPESEPMESEPMESEPKRSEQKEAPAAAVVIENVPASFKLTLNDKFRFRRTLFGGSDERMNRTLAMLAGLRNAADRDDYIVNDLCWNPDDPEVTDFIAVIDSQR